MLEAVLSFQQHHSSILLQPVTPRLLPRMLSPQQLNHLRLSLPPLPQPTLLCQLPNLLPLQLLPLLLLQWLLLLLLLLLLQL